MEDHPAQLKSISESLEGLVFPGQMEWQILIPWIGRPHQPIAFHAFSSPFDAEQYQRFARQLPNAQPPANASQEASGVAEKLHRPRKTSRDDFSVGRDKNTMNCANTVSSATIGVPLCRRTSTSTSTIENHCHRDRRNRSRRSVKTNRVRGAIRMLSSVFARARKHATAKKLESSISINNAWVLNRPPTDTRSRPRQCAHRQTSCVAMLQRITTRTPA